MQELQGLGLAGFPAPEWSIERLQNVGHDPEVWSGFALGTGLERIAMLKYDLEDIRDLLRNDRRFLKGYRRAII